MNKFLLVSLQIFIILVLIIFVINKSFLISAEINDYIYSIKSEYIFLIFLILFIIIFLIQNYYLKIKYGFKQFITNKNFKRKEKGYNAFIEGMIALANKDFKKVTISNKKVSEYLSENPSLSLLLKSETLKIENKHDKLSEVYEDMIKNSVTENLGLRGMMEYYLQFQDYHHAYIYGEKLFNKNPFIEKIYETLVNLIAKTVNWQQLINITEEALRKNIIDKQTYNENKSIGLFEIAKIKKINDPEESIKLIQKAIKLRNNFPPYIELYIEILIQEKKYNTAKKFLKKIWNQNPYLDYKHLIKKISNSLETNYLDLVRYIIGSSIEKDYSKILLIEALIENNNWENARKEIIPLLDIRPKKIICLLMAKIEEGENNDIQKANAWKMRSNEGAENYLWICSITHKHQNTWSSVSNSGHFNSLEWKQPNMLKEVPNMDSFND